MPTPRELDQYETDNTPSPQHALIDQQQAVVVGIGAYQDRSLANAAHDATAVAEVLREQYRFTLVSDTKPLLDVAATRAAICTIVDESLAAAREHTRWLFYIASHGWIDHTRHGQGYLLPVDAQKNTPDSFIPIQWLIDQMHKSVCAEALLILDVYYGG